MADSDVETSLLSTPPADDMAEADKAGGFAPIRDDPPPSSADNDEAAAAEIDDNACDIDDDAYFDEDSDSGVVGKAKPGVAAPVVAAVAAGRPGPRAGLGGGAHTVGAGKTSISARRRRAALPPGPRKGSFQPKRAPVSTNISDRDRRRARMLIYGGLLLMTFVFLVIASYKVPLWFDNGQLIWPWTEVVQQSWCPDFLKTVSK